MLDLRRTRRSLWTDDYANCVVVCGMGADGRPVRAISYDAASLFDPSSDRYVGWRKMDVWTLRGCVGQDTVNRLATERLQELSPRPEHVALVTPLLPEAGIGQVLRINGGETVGAAGQRYRITAVRHVVERQPAQIATTTIEARWIGGEA